MDSTGEIQAVKYYEDNSIRIKYTIPSSSNWNNKSPQFYMNNKKKDKCVLNVSCSSQGSYKYSLSSSIEFLNNDYSFGPKVEFEVTIWFNQCNIGYTFKLMKKKTHEKVYDSSACNFYDSKLTSFSPITVYVKISHEKVDNIDNITIYKSFMNSFKNILASEDHADLKLKVANKTFNVHKCIISSRCSVLKKMIESDMLEKKNGEITFTDWDPVVVKEVLTYIYTNECEIATVPHELFKLAHFLELKNLKLNCIKYLLQNINLKNIISTLELINIDQYELEELRMIANDFVSQNEFILVKDLEFQDYLINNIQMSNLEIILRIANTHNLPDVLSHAMEFVRLNYNEVTNNNQCKDLLLSQPNLLLDIFKYSSDIYTAQLKCKKEGK